MVLNRCYSCFKIEPALITCNIIFIFKGKDDIGKSLVGMMLEGSGFEVIDLGKDVSPENFINAVKNERPNIVALSALLTTTMRSMGHTITALKESGLRETVKIMVGGAPVTTDFANKIGADGYAANAPGAVELAKKFINLS